jgi:hypothetical protein
MAILTGSFTSLWDNSSITTQSTLDTDTGKLNTETVNDIPNDLGSLIKETFICGDDSYEVCPVCHEYILKTVINPDQVGNGLSEEQVCSNSDCSE